MLHSLTIKDFILIKKLEIEFDKGLNIITGETGSGKTIILDAISFCLGDKFSSGVIRHGASCASVVCVFLIDRSDQIRYFLINSILSELGIEFDQEIIIKHIRYENNKSKFFINDEQVARKTILNLSSILLELNRQNSQYNLLTSSNYLDILDNYADLNNLVNSVSQLFEEVQKINIDLSEKKKEKSFLDKEASYLEHISGELEKANIKIGEEKELIEHRSVLQNSYKIQQKLISLQKLINEPVCLEEILAKIFNTASKHSENFPQLMGVTSRFAEVYELFSNAESELQKLIEEFDEKDIKKDLDLIEERLFLIQNLTRKHYIASDELAGFLACSKEKLKNLENIDHDIKKLEQELLEIHKKYFKLAKELSEKRKKAAKNLENALHEELKLLKMEETILKIDFLNQNLVESKKGVDDIIFLVSTNKGSGFASLAKIASGGEISRFMLAFSIVLSSQVRDVTLIFDEIDTGIGGVVAGKVGQRLRYLSNDVQLIVVTHQAQVAAKATRHILVFKFSDISNTYIEAKILNKDDHIKEIARMLSGEEITQNTIKAAQDLSFFRSK